MKTPSSIYGLVGKTLGHSFSQAFFTGMFSSLLSTDYAYLNFELPDIGDLMEMISENPNLKGFNVTIPYKEQILPLLSHIDDVADEIGAVNVVKIERENDDVRLCGFNTDIIGFRKSIMPMLSPDHKKALILGTGGASRAVVHALKQIGIESTLISRKEKDGCATYNDLTPAIITDTPIIVNTTPLGMYPHQEECPDIPYDALTPHHVVYDLVYNPMKTLFLEKSAVAHTKNGLEMLMIQGFESAKIWGIAQHSNSL